MRPYSFLLLIILILVIKITCINFQPALAKSSYFNAPQPVLWYNFSGTDSIVIDSSGYSFNGTIQGPVIQENNSVQLNGSAANYITTNSDSLLSGYGEFTASFLFRYDTVAQRVPMQLIAKGTESYYISYSGHDSSMNFHHEHYATYDIQLPFRDTSFHEFVAVYRYNQVTAYLDGSLLGQISVVPNVQNSDDIHFGQYFKGKFSEIKLYNTALNSYQIQSIFQPDTLPPENVNLSGTAISSHSIALSWAPAFDSIGVAGYEIYRNGILVDTCSATYYVDDVPYSNQSYEYYLRACDYSGNRSNYHNNRINVNVCYDIQPLITNTEYAVCDYDTIALPIGVADFNYTYQWQKNVLDNWVDLEETEKYFGTNTRTLILNTVRTQELPNIYRLAIKNICGTTYSENFLVQAQEEHTLSGQVYCGSDPLHQGIAYLFDTIYPATPTHTTGILNGDYTFTNICPGNYYLKAKPLGETSELYAPRYYTDANHYPQPIPLNIFTHFSHVNIDLIPHVLTTPSAKESILRIYPTLVTSHLTLEWKSRIPQSVSIQVFNSQGIIVYQEKLLANQAKQQVDLTTLPASMYFVRIRSSNTILAHQKILLNSGHK